MTDSLITFSESMMTFQSITGCEPTHFYSNRKTMSNMVELDGLVSVAINGLTWLPDEDMHDGEIRVVTITLIHE